MSNTTEQNLNLEAVSVKDGAVVGTEKLFHGHLTDNGMTIDDYNRATKLRDDFLPKALKPVGEANQDLLKANPDMKTVTTIVPMGSDRMVVTTVAKRESPNPAKPGETVITYGATTLAYEVPGAERRGEIKKVSDLLKKRGLEKLGE